MKKKNMHLDRAKKVKDDEFYTPYETVEEELKYYHSELKGKTVYCNCDNSDWSEFWCYFIDNFEKI